MTAVTFPNGNQYSDDGTTANDMRNGGFRTSLLPMIGDTITVANSAVTAAASAVPAATTATTAATTATAAAATAVAAANTAVGTSLIKQPSEIAGIDPALDFVFSSALALPAGVVQSASAKWVTDRAGLLTSVASLTPPIDFDPVTSVTRGLLVEEGRTNLLTYSQAFDNAAWTKGTASVSANAVAAPDGATTADKIVASSSTATSHYVSQQFASSPADNTTYTISVYAKAAELTKLLIQVRDKAAGYGTQTFDISAVSATAGGTVSSTGRITSVGSGWYRCSVTWSVGTGSSLSTFATEIFLLNASGSVSFSGDGSSGLYLWQAQSEAASVASSPIITTSSTVTRAADANPLLLASVPGWNANEGTIYVEFDVLGLKAGGDQNVITLDDGTANNRISLRVDASSVLALMVNSGSVVVQNTHSGTLAPLTTYKMAFAWAANDAASSIGGAAALTDSSLTVPSVTTLRLGSYAPGAQLNGHIRRAVLFPRRLSNATLQALTA